MTESSLGDAQVLRLTSWHLAVELREPEECSPVPLVLDLGGLTLAEELLVTHEAMATRHLERDDDSVTRLDGGDVLSDFLDEPYLLVAEDVSGFHEGRQGLVEVKIRAANVGARDPHDGVRRFFDGESGTESTLTRRFACQVTASCAPFRFALTDLSVVLWAPSRRR